MLLQLGCVCGNLGGPFCCRLTWEDVIGVAAARQFCLAVSRQGPV